MNRDWFWNTQRFRYFYKQIDKQTFGINYPIYGKQIAASSWGSDILDKL